MSNEVGVISRLLNIVERYGVSVEHTSQQAVDSLVLW